MPLVAHLRFASQISSFPFTGHIPLFNSLPATYDQNRCVDGTYSGSLFTGLPYRSSPPGGGVVFRGLQPDSKVPASARSRASHIVVTCTIRRNTTCHPRRVTYSPQNP